MGLDLGSKYLTYQTAGLVILLEQFLGGAVLSSQCRAVGHDADGVGAHGVADQVCMRHEKLH